MLPDLRDLGTENNPRHIRRIGKDLNDRRCLILNSKADPGPHVQDGMAPGTTREPTEDASALSGRLGGFPFSEAAEEGHGRMSGALFAGAGEAATG